MRLISLLTSHTMLSCTAAAHLRQAISGVLHPPSCAFTPSNQWIVVAKLMMQLVHAAPAKCCCCSAAAHTVIACCSQGDHTSHQLCVEDTP
jgi:hypothetical protein